MKHLILGYQNTIFAIGSVYTTTIENNRTIHIVDGLRFDQSFTHVEVDEVPTDFAIGIYKFIDGQFVENTDRTAEIEQSGYLNGYDQAILDIIGGAE